MNSDTLQSRLSRLGMLAFLVGVAGLAASGAGAFFNPRQFFISYLTGYLFWLGLALGCLGLLMIHHLTGGRWGWPLRRFYEAAIMTLPLMALLFIPVCLGIPDLYLWADAHAVALSPVMQHRAVYMNTTAFMIRASVFFVIWIVVAMALNKWSFQQDATTSAEPTRWLRTLSGPGIMFYPLTATFVFVDWVLSLEPEWYSTMFLVLIVIGQMLTAIAFSILLLAWLRKTEPFSGIITPVHFHHFGMLLLAFVMLWTYMAFSEFLIIYSGNQPREIAWYLHRIAGNCKVVVWFLFLFHFLLPFFMLLSRDLKRKVPLLAGVAAVVFLAHFVDTYWLVAPSFFKTGIHFHWLDLTAPAGIGGLWLAAFATRLKGRSPMVANDPRQQPLTHDGK